MLVLRTAPVFFLFFLCSCAKPEAKLSLAYINSGQVMQQYHGTAVKRIQIEAKARLWQHSLDSISSTLNTKLTSAEHESRLASYRLSYQQSLQKASQVADQELLAEVNTYLKSFGAAKKYDLIFGANDSGNIVYAAPAHDLTKEVIQELNQQYDALHPNALPVPNTNLR